MNLAGHATFETTHSYYLSVEDDLVQRARAASSQATKGIFIANPMQVPFSGENKKGRQP